jgi:glycosyltransferase involved in cell wall biosynthesis
VSTRYGFVSTYPPTQCGLATFTVSLRHEMSANDGDEGLVARVVDVPSPRPAPEVVAEIVMGSESSVHRAAAQLNRCDIVIVQHEYGIFGGPDGDQVLTLLDALTVPCIVVLHTVPLQPTWHQREVLEAVVRRAQWTVTMTDTARERLAAHYAVDLDAVSTIAHGASPALVAPMLGPVARTGRPTVLTWGLMGPGKGIEWGIDAMAKLRDLDPMPQYVVAGQTHPKVVARDGETYRSGLQQQAEQLGLGDAVVFDGRYRDVASLAALVRSADVVLLPYDSLDQVTSGVLIEAVAAAKPVIATRFPHAVELLGSGAGVVVPHRSADAIAAALRDVLTHSAAAKRMAEVAARTAPALMWPAVAEQYRSLARRLITARVAA